MNYNIEQCLRNIPNMASMPDHLFLKRAQRCDSYFFSELRENTNDLWADYAFPDIILMRASDGWEITFPVVSIGLVYDSFIRRDQFFMGVLRSINTYPQCVEHHYSLSSISHLNLNALTP